MTRSDFIQIVESFDLPYCYYQFPNGQAPSLPFVVYYFPNRDDVMADNENYVHVEDVIIELYTETRDFDLEDSFEANIPFPYEKTVEYINSERMYRTTYESEVIIDGE